MLLRCRHPLDLRHSILLNIDVNRLRIEVITRFLELYLRIVEVIARLTVFVG